MHMMQFPGSQRAVAGTVAHSIDFMFDAKGGGKVGGCSSSSSSVNVSKGRGGLKRRQRQHCGRVRCANGEDRGSKIVTVMQS